MAQKPLTDQECKAAISAYNVAKGNVTQAAVAMGIPHPTFQNRLRRARARFPALLQSFPVSRGGTPPEQRTVEEDVVLHRARESDSHARAKLKDATRIIAALEDKIRDFEYAAKRSLEPALWASNLKPSKSAHEHIPYLLTSDFQIGEVVRPEETETGYGYNSSIFIQRYRQMIDLTIYLSFGHSGKDWKFPGIIYARGGDTISGGIHDELKETDDLTPIEAVECAFETESAGILKLADAFGKVEVKTPGAAGNHDRNLAKPTTKKSSAHSYDRLINYMLGKHFARDPRVTFQTSESFDVRFPIYDQNIILTHGDRMGSSGGQGFVGPMATIMRGAQKVIMEQAALGHRIDRVDHGHFHTPGYMGWVLSNGTTVGYSEYAKSYRMRPSPPTQMLAFHHRKHGLVDLKPLILLD